MLRHQKYSRLIDVYYRKAPEDGYNGLKIKKCLSTSTSTKPFNPKQVGVG